MRHTKTTPPARSAGGVLALVVALVLSVLAPVAAAPVAAAVSATEAGPDTIVPEALSASSFDPGNIISDANFYNRAAMTEAEIQAFLQAKVGTCGNANCLAAYRVDTPNRTWGFGTCAPYTGAPAESAARIIYKVQQACGLSAKVILTTLQKEQSLITATAPTDGVMRKAMGYGCPDTSVCDSTYYGFFNQVFAAARQLTWYSNPEGSFTTIKIGQVNQVRYSPTASCGSGPVLVQNKATAALYYYTPYQPNAAALANLHGTGDACSSYGNRNFWVFYNEYFGVPTLGNKPMGDVNAVTPSNGAITVRGWAFDPDTQDPIKVDVYVNNVWTQTLTADGARSDVQAAYPSAQLNTGYSSTFKSTAGSKKVCLYGINVGIGSNQLIGCRTVSVTVVVYQPVGDINTLVATPAKDGVSFSGWALDRDTTGPILVDVWADGKWRATVTANTSRPDVGKAYPGMGDNHGFSGRISLSPGAHSVCLYAINAGGGSGNPLLGCRSVTLTLATTGVSPIGDINGVSRSGLTASIWGWTFDGDTTAPILADVWVNGRYAATLTADKARPDVGAAYPAAGPNHGFSGSVAVSAGTNNVCVYGINVGVGAHKLLGCRSVVVPVNNPKGDVNAVARSGDVVNVRGWAFDADTKDPILVDVWSNGAYKATLRADQARPDVQAAYPQQSANHGFAGSIPATTGPQTVCLYGINVGLGAHTLLGCRTV